MCCCNFGYDALHYYGVHRMLQYDTICQSTRYLQKFGPCFKMIAVALVSPAFWHSSIEFRWAGQIHQESRNTLNRPNILVHCPTHLDNPSKSIISKTRTKGKAVRLGTQLLFSTVVGSRVCGPVGAHLASPMAQVFRFGKGFFKQRTFEMMDEKQMLWPKFWFARFVVNLLQVLCSAWTSACFIMNL